MIANETKSLNDTENNTYTSLYCLQHWAKPMIY